MTAATVDRNTKHRPGLRRSIPVAAATKLPAGVIACVSAAGLLVNGITSPTLKTVGVAAAAIDNSTGADSAIAGEVDRGVHGPFANSAGGEQIVLADVTNDCYVVDNQTVAKTSGGATRSVAGKVYDVTPEGVWIDFR